MKQQIVRIHWWEAKENYIDFEDYLNKLEYKPEWEKKLKWWKTLEKDLWKDEYEVFQPQMPNKMFATYSHRKIMFEKVILFLREDVILIWHSMWATFLVKYLDENNFPINIKKIYLISWAFDDIKWDIIGTFRFDQKLENLKKYKDKIVLIHSKDDFIVPFSHFENFKKVLNNSETHVFKDRWHFIDETFSELIDYIKRV